MKEKKEKNMNPKKHLEYYSLLYPSAWKHTDKFRAGRGKDLPSWPEWCFLPITASYAIVSTEAEAQGIYITDPVSGFPLLNDVGIIGALAAWRVTQGVYRFDRDVYDAVINTPITGDLPHDIFFNLPEWCIYIETPGLSFLEQPLAGFYAYLEYDTERNRKELRLILDYTTPDNEHPWLMSQVIHLGPWSLMESAERAMKEAERATKSLLKTDTPFPLNAAEHMRNQYVPLISLLLYICSVNGEVGDGERQPTRPLPTKTKKGIRIFPPGQATVWDVGVRMGAALRRAAARNADTDTATENDTPGKQRSSPRSHVRRAHWHGYWTGHRKEGQKFVLKWISPVLVGSGEEKEIPVTIRPVK
jgi:hypothetical protein